MIELLEGEEGTTLVVSSLTAVEIRSAIRRRLRAGDLNAADADNAIWSLENEIKRLIEQPLSQTVCEQARGLIDRHPLRALDALQLASCLAAKEMLRVREMYFVTSDAELGRAASAEGLPLLNPERV